MRKGKGYQGVGEQKRKKNIIKDRVKNRKKRVFARAIGTEKWKWECRNLSETSGRKQ